MRKEFVKTKNVKNFCSVLNNIQNRPDGVPGMALIYGEPGLGKTKTTIWWAVNNGAILISAKNSMSPRWLLEELVLELGETPMFKTSDLFNQAVRQLINLPRTIIVDEIDYLAANNMAIETLRDLHDRTAVPIVMVGMGLVDKKLSRYKHLYDRFSEILKFQPFDYEDVKMLINELSEVKLSEDAIALIFNNANRFRQIVKFINKAESIAKTNELSEIKAENLRNYLTEIKKAGRY